MLKDHKKIWSDCLKIIKNEISEQSFKTWFQPIVSCQYKEDTLTIQVPSKFFYEWLEENYLILLRTTINSILGLKGKLKYSIKEEKVSDTPRKDPIYIGLESTNLKANLNPAYTFDNFIEGDSNRLTKSAAQSIAKNPGKTAFNPIIIHAKTGLGKTHVGQAIVHDVNHNFGNQLKTLYIPSEKFTHQFIEGVRNNSWQKFVGYYTSLDLLVIDDIQFLAGKDKTQEIFFTIFNHLHQSNKQIVMTSDCRPADLAGLQQRLLSRFKWGLTTDLQMPNFETRIAIIHSKLLRNNIRIDNNLIEYIATSIETNVRDIEGVITSLIAHASLNNKSIDYALIKSTLENIVSKVNTELSLDYLQKTIASYYKFSVNDLKSKSRKREIVMARQVAMYLIKEYTNLSLKTIGQHFGGKDHSTVIYAQKSINNLLDTDRYFKTKFEVLEKLIKRKIPPKQ